MVKSQAAAHKIVKEFSRQANREFKQAEPEGRLTEREIDVLKLVATGALNKEIASMLNVTMNTVKYHLRNIMGKLHLSNRTQIATYAISKDLLPQKK